jgi:hypothetical protein
MSEKAPNPLVSEFIANCKAQGLEPGDVVKAAGIHRGVWHRWRTGAFAPNMKNWGAVQSALSQMAESRAA